MTPDDPRHGTNAGYIAHMFSDRSPCQPCKDGQATYKRRSRARLYLARVESLSCPSIGSVRRVQALVAVGHTMREIDAELGNSYGTTSRWLKSTGTTVFRSTAERIEGMYDRMCMQVPQGKEADRARRRASRQGWLPPLAWENVDDPDECPTAQSESSEDVDEVAVERCLSGALPARHLTLAERELAVRLLHALGLSDSLIAARLRANIQTVFRTRHRIGLGSNDPAQPSKEGAA